MPVLYEIPHLPMLGKGSLLADIYYPGGAPSGAFLHLGNCTKVDQEIKDDRDELYQSINAVPSMIASAVKKRQVILSITGTDFSSDHMAVGLMSGGKTTLATGTTPVTAEVLVSVAASANLKDRFFSLVGRNVTPGTIVLTQSGSPLVLGTDYIIADALQGLIYFPKTTGATGAAAITAAYTPAAMNLDQVAGATKAFVKAHLRFAPDPTDGQAIGVDWWNVNLSPTGKLGLIADTYGNWELEAMVLDDTANHPASPYFLSTFYPSPA
jgi:hypothetical protein